MLYCVCLRNSNCILCILVLNIHKSLKVVLWMYLTNEMLMWLTQVHGFHPQHTKMSERNMQQSRTCYAFVTNNPQMPVAYTKIIFFLKQPISHFPKEKSQIVVTISPGVSESSSSFSIVCQ